MRVDYEVELAAIIGHEASNIDADEISTLVVFLAGNESRFALAPSSSRTVASPRVCLRSISSRPDTPNGRPQNSRSRVGIDLLTLGPIAHILPRNQTFRASAHTVRGARILARSKADAADAVRRSVFPSPPR